MIDDYREADALYAVSVVKDDKRITIREVFTFDKRYYNLTLLIDNVECELVKDNNVMSYSRYSSVKDIYSEDNLNQLEFDMMKAVMLNNFKRKTI